MRINGIWHLCDDRILRPVVPAEIQARDGAWVKALFLVDTGADRTVFSADVLQALQLQPLSTDSQLGGVGGVTPAIIVDTRIRLTDVAQGKVMLRGHYAAVTDIIALDMSVLGRDILNLFAIIVDWPQRLICLLSQRHHYLLSP